MPVQRHVLLLPAPGLAQPLSLHLFPTLESAHAIPVLAESEKEQ